jgi:hypothetical protein
MTTDHVPDRRAEIALELEHLDLLDRYVAAKKNEAKDPDEYRDAKKAFSDHRTYWRQIGEAVGTRIPGAHGDSDDDGNATARPAAIKKETK